MATFLDIKTAVEGNVIDLPTFVQDSVDALINRAYRKAQSLHNFWVMRAEYSPTTTADTRLLPGTFPTNWKEWRGKPYYTEDTGAKRRMELLPSLDAARAKWDEDDVGDPQGLAEILMTEAGLSGLNVYPLPDGNSDYDDGEYRITVPYYKYLPVLSGDADTNWLVTEGEEWIEAEATRQAFIKDWDEERATFWQKEAGRAWKDLQLRDKYKVLSMTETMAVHSGPYAVQGE